MKFRSGLMAAVAGTFLLSGCANWDVDGTAAMPNEGDAFAAALQEQYIERARFEVEEGDWGSVDFFTSRAELAAKGMPPAPQAPSERTLKVEVDEIGMSHAKLVDALAAGSAKVNPVACAQSQAWLEHWMEQSEEGHQPDHIAMARVHFEKSIVNCVPKAMKMTDAPTFRIYFPFDSDTLTSEARAVVDDIVAFFSGSKPTAVHVAGHTDTAGPKAYNAKLGMERAKAVSEVLSKEGVAPISETSYGETNLPKPTADGVIEQENRQVTVTFKQ